MTKDLESASGATIEEYEARGAAGESASGAAGPDRGASAPTSAESAATSSTAGTASGNDPRYSRQVTVPGVGRAGQEALSRARILCIGAGGLGSPAALYLAAAGVGTLGIVDADTVELSNLHRQVLHTTARVGEPKTASAAAALHALNPQVTVRTHETRVTRENALELFADYDMVLDGADNFETRYIASDATTLLDIPHVWASVLGAGGQLSVFHASRGPVLRDVFPRIPDPGSVPSCVQAGVLGVVPGILGVAMAAEALKLVLGYGTPLVGTLQVYDMATGIWDALPVRPNPAVRRPTSPAEVGAGLAPRVSVETLVGRLRSADARTPAEEPTPVYTGPRPSGSVPSAAESSDIDRRTPVLIDVREPEEVALGVIAGAQLWPLSRLAGGPDPFRGGEAVGTRASEPSSSTPLSTVSGSGDFDALADLVREASEVVVYCKAGSRSAQVTAELAARGVVVPDLDGGFDAFVARAPELVTIPDLPRDHLGAGRIPDGPTTGDSGVGEVNRDYRDPDGASTTDSTTDGTTAEENR